MKPTNPIAALIAISPLLLLGCSEEGGSATEGPPPSSDWTGGGQAPTHTHDHPHAEEGTIQAAGLVFDLPEGWTLHPPSNMMRIADVHAPNPSGDPEQDCIAAFSTAGGDTESNITRWLGQFSNPAGGAVPSARETRTVAGRTVALVEVTGDYHGMGMGPSQPDQMMRAAIIGLPTNQSLFIKMTGPRERMETLGDGWDALINSMRTP